MFGLYVQFHGDYSPGGGFKLELLAAAFILHAIAASSGPRGRISTGQSLDDGFWRIALW